LGLDSRLTFRVVSLHVLFLPCEDLKSATVQPTQKAFLESKSLAIN